jgi:hypothetical protein
MEKKQVYVLLDEMCQDIEIMENSRSANLGKAFVTNLATLTEEPNILQIIIDRMAKEDVPYLDEVLCHFTLIEGIDLTEKQMIQLAKIPSKSTIYSEDEIIGAIMMSVKNKISRPTIKKLALSLEKSADTFFSDYCDRLWDNIFKADITEEEKDKARRIYEETKDWFFDEGWL